MQHGSNPDHWNATPVGHCAGWATKLQPGDVQLGCTFWRRTLHPEPPIYFPKTSLNGLKLRNYRSMCVRPQNSGSFRILHIRLVLKAIQKLQTLRFMEKLLEHVPTRLVCKWRFQKAVGVRFRDSSSILRSVFRVHFLRHVTAFMTFKLSLHPKPSHTAAFKYFMRTPKPELLNSESLGFDWLEVASSSTHLVEAIDWHIILMKFQRLAKEIFSQGHADDYPLVSETLQSILDEHTQQGGRAPTLTFALRMYFRNGEKHKLFRFFRTTDLRWVLHCRTRHLVLK